MIWKMSPIISKSKIQQKKKVLIVFNDMIADATSNKELQPVVTELTQYFGFHYTVIVSWSKRCKTKYYIFLYHEDPPKKQEIQQIAIDHLLILTPKTSWSYTENALQKIFVFSHFYYSSIRYCFTFSKKSAGRSLESRHNN